MLTFSSVFTGTVNFNQVNFQAPEKIGFGEYNLEAGPFTLAWLIAVAKKLLVTYSCGKTTYELVKDTYFITVTAASFFQASEEMQNRVAEIVASQAWCESTSVEVTYYGERQFSPNSILKPNY